MIFFFSSRAVLSQTRFYVMYLLFYFFLFFWSFFMNLFYCFVNQMEYTTPLSLSLSPGISGSAFGKILNRHVFFFMHSIIEYGSSVKYIKAGISHRGAFSWLSKSFFSWSEIISHKKKPSMKAFVVVLAVCFVGAFVSISILVI